MTQQYDRRVRLVISGTETKIIDNLKFDFEIEKSLASEPNTAKISIYNLSPTTRHQLERQQTKFAFFAGYGEELGLIFRGFTRNANTTKDSSGNIITTISSGDGDKDFTRSTVFITLPKNSKTSDAVKAISSNFQDTAQGKSETIEKTYKRPVVLAGEAKTELNKTVSDNGGTWSIQDGELELLTEQNAINDVILVNQDTGMVGPPTVTEKGVEVEMLLNPRIKPGRIIKVESNFSQVQENANNYSKADSDLGAGFFKIEKVIFKGTNIGQDFYSKVTGVRRGS